jgi:ADP-ribosylglycohydrolase
MIEGEEDVYAAYDQAMIYAEHYIANVMVSDPKCAELLEELKYIAEWENHECTGTGFVVDSFWTAIKVMNVAESYEDAIKRSIGYGNDTDTTACIAGGLAGIKYGYQGIPDRWIEQLRGKEIIRRVVDRWLFVTAVRNVRNIYPLEVAQALISVQPMPEVDWEELERSSLWQSYCARHFGEDK